MNKIWTENRCEFTKSIDEHVCFGAFLKLQYNINMCIHLGRDFIVGNQQYFFPVFVRFLKLVLCLMTCLILRNYPDRNSRKIKVVFGGNFNFASFKIKL